MGDPLLDAAAASAVAEVAAADGLVAVEDATDNDDTAMEGEVGATGDDWADDPGTAAVAAAVAAASAAWVLSMMRPSPSCNPMSPSSANALSAAPGLTHASAAASAPLAGSKP
jgi:hypothetical protein